MKIKEWIRLLGFKPKIKTYSSEIKPIQEEGYTHLKWAEWQHPKVRAVRPRFTDIQTLSRWIKPGDFVIDIGAHVGDTTLPYAHLVGKEGICLALEPNPAVFKVLEENARINQKHLNIVPVQAASSNQEETLKFSYSDPGLCNGGNSDCYSFWERKSFFEIEVPAINLKNYLEIHFANRLDRLRFIKTDVEGFDYALFKHHTPLIQKYRPVLQVEVYSKLPQEEKKHFAESIKALNYTLYFVGDVTLANMRPLNDQDLKTEKTFDLFCIPNEMV